MHDDDDLDELLAQPGELDLVPPTAISLDVGVLGDARRAATTTAGNVASTNGNTWPFTNKVQIGDFIFLLSPVVPIQLSNGVIQLYCEAWAGSSATVIVGPGLDAEAGRGAPVTGRDLYAVCTFGVANSRHTVELDLTIGAAVRLPTATIEVEFFDETPRPTLDGDPPPPYHRLQAAAHAAYLPAGAPAMRTQRCWFPIWGEQLPDGELDLDDLFALLA